jgi:thiol-disulfide isomerase/thioredoxin
MNPKFPFYFLLVSTLLFTACSKPKQVSTTVISGKLVNWGNAEKILRAQDIKSDFGLGESFILTTDENDRFEVTFELVEATYFSLGRNKLFIQPGDHLDMAVDYRDPEAGVFQGDGAEIQSYLGGVAFPKSGSYLQGGTNVKGPEMEPIVALAKKNTEERAVALAQLGNVNPEFLKLEEMRLRLDYFNTILSFPIYGSFKDYWENTEDKKAEILLAAKKELDSASNGIMKDEYMKHPNFRDMLLTFSDGQIKTSGIFTDLKMTAFMREYDALGALISELELAGLTTEMKEQANAFMNEQHSAEYQEMVQMKLDEYQALEEGQPAFDVTFRTVDDAPVNLSQFKGKLTYVDLWATWCGPCIDELPAFEQLRQDYSDKDINFIPVSIDTDLNAWKKYLQKHDLTENELVINRLDLADYKVITIPRYLLIDKDFKIISVFAPLPSSDEIRALIDQNL